MTPFILSVLYPDPQTRESGSGCDLCCGECGRPCPFAPEPEECP